ncbi:hypothetical protein BN2537_11825 [Streptomyces venezuelae]|nr:hypothetical protein BN2537_11825 [Streptomyces venezuelae]
MPAGIGDDHASNSTCADSGRSRRARPRVDVLLCQGLLLIGTLVQGGL